jgi:hypothetical protein
MRDSLAKDTFDCAEGCEECVVAFRARRERPDVKRSAKYEGNPHWCPAWEVMDAAPGFELPEKDPFTTVPSTTRKCFICFTEHPDEEAAKSHLRDVHHAE